MRELKFRAWDKEERRYLLPEMQEFVILPTLPSFGVTIPYQNRFDESLTDEVCIDWADADLIMGRYELEQYTGIKDKNGKMIYEGDIVEQFVCGIHQYKGKKCGRSTIWQVRWNEQECCFELHYLRGSLFGDSMMSDDGEYEVIGNIHEPPKDFRPEHLKRMGISISKGGEEC